MISDGNDHNPTRIFLREMPTGTSTSVNVGFNATMNWGCTIRNLVVVTPASGLSVVATDTQRVASGTTCSTNVDTFEGGLVCAIMGQRDMETSTPNVTWTGITEQGEWQQGTGDSHGYAYNIPTATESNRLVRINLSNGSGDEAKVTTAAFRVAP